MLFLIKISLESVEYFDVLFFHWNFHFLSMFILIKTTISIKITIKKMCYSLKTSTKDQRLGISNYSNFNVNYIFHPWQLLSFHQVLIELFWIIQFKFQFTIFFKQLKFITEYLFHWQKINVFLIFNYIFTINTTKWRINTRYFLKNFSRKKKIYFINNKFFIFSNSEF